MLGCSLVLLFFLFKNVSSYSFAGGRMGFASTNHPLLSKHLEASNPKIPVQHGIGILGDENLCSHYTFEGSVVKEQRLI